MKVRFDLLYYATLPPLQSSTARGKLCSKRAPFLPRTLYEPPPSHLLHYKGAMGARSTPFTSNITQTSTFSLTPLPLQSYAQWQVRSARLVNSPPSPSILPHNKVSLSTSAPLASQTSTFTPPASQSHGQIPLLSLHTYPPSSCTTRSRSEPAPLASQKLPPSSITCSVIYKDPLSSYTLLSTR